LHFIDFEKNSFIIIDIIKDRGFTQQGGNTMVYHPKSFGTVLKNARMDKKLTQAELAEILNISLSYLKDLERFRNNPSYEVFEKVIRFFNLSADTVIYPENNQKDSTYQQIVRLLTQCDEKQLCVILATARALQGMNENYPMEKTDTLKPPKPM